MSGASAEEIRSHVRVYIAVFLGLGVLTAATVGAYYMHLPHNLAIGVALTIATIKAALVALYFMHLVSERTIIYAVLCLTVVFFAVLLLLPSFTEFTVVQSGK